MFQAFQFTSKTIYTRCEYWYTCSALSIHTKNKICSSSISRIWRFLNGNPADCQLSKDDPAWSRLTHWKIKVDYYIAIGNCKMMSCNFLFYKSNIASLIFLDHDQQNYKLWPGLLIIKAPFLTHFKDFPCLYTESLISVDFRITCCFHCYT